MSTNESSTDNPSHRNDQDIIDSRSDAGSAGGFDRDRERVVDRDKEEYGGVKIGSAFFGWLTATGTAVLLTALVAAAGTAGRPGHRHQRG